MPHLGHTTNNRIESHNQKIKAFLKPEMHFCVAVKELLNYARTVKNSVIHACFNELKTPLMEENSDLHAKFVAISTHAACTLIFKQIDIFKEGTYSIEIISYSLNNVISKEKNYDVKDLTSCTCSFFSQYELPCQHIFAARFALKNELFDETNYS